MCFFRRVNVPMPKPEVDPEIEKQKAETKARSEAEKLKQEQFQKRVQGGKVGRRSLISGESGGIGFYK